MIYTTKNMMNFFREHGELRLDTVAHYLNVSEQEVIVNEFLPIDEVDETYKNKFAIMYNTTVDQLDKLNWPVSMTDIEFYMDVYPKISEILLKHYGDESKSPITYKELNEFLKHMEDSETN